ncbi:MAG: hypothetical protein HQ402_03565 [Parcubacteria group bacterium]|nr:hypothetical protein [Parcubacteria group bacterium]
MSETLQQMVKPDAEVIALLRLESLDIGIFRIKERIYLSLPYGSWSIYYPIMEDGTVSTPGLIYPEDSSPLSLIDVLGPESVVGCKIVDMKWSDGRPLCPPVDKPSA